MKMLRIGLTGGIGMGKSCAAKMLRNHGFLVHDADAVVRNLLERKSPAAQRVAKRFPEAVKRRAGGSWEISRAALAKRAFENPKNLKAIEGILHPFVRKAEREFLQAARRNKAKAVILEIPLLFETGAESRCDIVLCVSAPEKVRTMRVMRRPGMTKERFAAILARQMPEEAKKRRADYVIPTGKGFTEMRKALKKALLKIGVWEDVFSEHPSPRPGSEVSGSGKKTRIR